MHRARHAPPPSAPMLDFGLTTEAFLRQHFERAPLLRRAALQSPAFSWRDLDELLHHIEPTEAGFQLFRNGLVAQAQYTLESATMGLHRRRLHKRRFWAQLHSGASVVLNRLEHHSSTMQRLCSDVARFCSLPTSGNAYLSIGGAGTFGRHWDTHDVFAVQLIGSKRWRVFEPTYALPLADQTSQRSPLPCPAQPLLDVTLQAGDLLYLPRGWWHEVLPGDGAELSSLDRQLCPNRSGLHRLGEPAAVARTHGRAPQPAARCGRRERRRKPAGPAFAGDQTRVAGAFPRRARRTRNPLRRFRYRTVPVTRCGVTAASFDPDRAGRGPVRHWRSAGAGRQWLKTAHRRNRTRHRDAFV